MDYLQSTETTWFFSRFLGRSICLLYPWVFVWGLLIAVKAKGLAKGIGRVRIAWAAAVSCGCMWLFLSGFGYEAQIAQEALVPCILAYPYVRTKVGSLPRLCLVLIPLVAFTVFENTKCTQGLQWGFLPDYPFLLWARSHGTFWERFFDLGATPDFPVIDLAFYPAYIALSFATVCACACLYGKSLGQERSLRWVFPVLYGPLLAVNVLLLVWYVRERGAIPFHALSAGMSLAFSWTMYLSSPAVRGFARTRLFLLLSAFGFVQTAIFEIIHSSIQMHWIYNPGAEMAGLAGWLDFRFPAITLLGMHPLSWPVEEWMAYVTIYTFVYNYVLWMDEKAGLRIFRDFSSDDFPAPGKALRL